MENINLTPSNADLILRLSQATNIHPGDLVNFMIKHGTDLCLAAADQSRNMNDLRGTLYAHPQTAFLCNTLWDGYAEGLKQAANKNMHIMKPD